jgi:hypothetical protein
MRSGKVGVGETSRSSSAADLADGELERLPSLNILRKIATHLAAVLFGLILGLSVVSSALTTWDSYRADHREKIERGLERPRIPRTGTLSVEWVEARAAFFEVRNRRVARLYHKWVDLHAEELAALVPVAPAPSSGGGGYGEQGEAAAAVIRSVFGVYGDQAVSVASCESGLRTWAANGQYLGLFQMGEWERATYGHGPDALTQSTSAYAYFADTGYDWSPWSCKP